MKFLVFGAGALGTFYGGRLAQAGHQVVVLARGKTLAALKTQGALQWVEGKTFHEAKVEVTDHPDVEVDAVLVLVRSHQMDAAMPALTISRSPTILTFVNHAGPLDRWKAALGDRLVLGFPGAAGMRDPDGNWSCQTVPRWMQPTTLGEPSGTSERVSRLCGVLEGAGFPTRACDDMPSWLRHHAAWIAPFGALGRLPADGTSPWSWPALGRFGSALTEARSVLASAGHPVNPPGLRWIHRVPPGVLTAGLWALTRLPVARHTLENAVAAGGDEMRHVSRQMVDLAERMEVEVPTWRSFC